MLNNESKWRAICKMIACLVDIVFGILFCIGVTIVCYGAVEKCTWEFAFGVLMCGMSVYTIEKTTLYLIGLKELDE